VKKRTVVLLVVLFSLILSGIAYSAQDIKIMMDGKAVASDVAPQLMNDRVLVPVRVISEGLGADVEWDGAQMAVMVTSPAKKFAANFLENGMYMKTGADAAALFAQGNVMVVDVRPDAVWSLGFIEGSMHVPVPMIPDNMDKFSKTETYLAYCSSDINAAFVTEMLINAGYKAFVVVGGMQSLLDNGFNQAMPEAAPMPVVEPAPVVEPMPTPY
jgi:rhodanese-related sulfurtransferase